MIHFSKNEKRELGKLAGLAYERELAKALEGLYARFLEWKKEDIDLFELNDQIHKFHNGISRDLWKVYDDRNNHIVIARAVANGIISMDEISIKLLEDLKPGIESFKNLQ